MTAGTAVAPRIPSADSLELGQPRGHLPSRARAKALSRVDRHLEVLHDIIESADASDKVKVTAIKLNAEIAAVRNGKSIPRDVVDQHIVQTAAYLRDKLGEPVYAALADGLSAIWDL